MNHLISTETSCRRDSGDDQVNSTLSTSPTTTAHTTSRVAVSTSSTTTPSKSATVPLAHTSSPDSERANSNLDPPATDMQRVTESLIFYITSTLALTYTLPALTSESASTASTHSTYPAPRVLAKSLDHTALNICLATIIPSLFILSAVLLYRYCPRTRAPGHLIDPFPFDRDPADDESISSNTETEHLPTTRPSTALATYSAGPTSTAPTFDGSGALICRWASKSSDYTASDIWQALEANRHNIGRFGCPR
jgi:hypothetical protein